MNLSCVGPHDHPKVQVIGSRGAPGNTINHATSYWVPRHTSRTFVEQVDFVSGIGVDRGGLVHQVISNLGVFDFDGPHNTMRVRSLHPGVTMDEVRENTGFTIDGDGSPTREPTPDEAELIAQLDPKGSRNTEVA
jgi:acyl CoA:acetate/3-ketoacid CoA transferase beta subunit